VPRNFSHHGNYVVSLGAVTRSGWGIRPKRSLGVEIFPGFAAAEVLYDEQGRVKGVATGNMGIGKDGQPHRGLPAWHGTAGQATPCLPKARAGHLARQLIARYGLADGRDTQSYAIGIKELWEVDAGNRPSPGRVIHTAGWPMDRETFGGGFLYHLEGNKVTLGFVVGPGLPKSLAEPVRGDAALEDPPGVIRSTSKAASVSAMARAPSTTAGRKPCRRQCFPAVRWWAATPDS
jgi:electron-transferring-flavoprotein dehydrogenase